VETVRPAIVRLEAGDYVGTGMIINRTGYILTCNHLIEGAESVTATLYDGRRYQASIVAQDEKKDLGLVRIAASGVIFPYVKMGSSEQLKSGEEILAIGYAMGLEGETTVSKGIVSAFRNFDGVDLIQTDAAVNPGCSGGPLLNFEAEVVGVLVGRWAGEDIQGMGFAVSASSAKDFITETTTLLNQEEAIRNAEQPLLELEEETFRLINLERQERGISPVQWDETLHSGARGHSQDMESEGHLYHDTGGTFAECCFYGSYTYATPQATVESWMSSTEGHREILLDAQYRYGVVGIAKNNDLWATYRCY
jgi:hypothetical protein